jgi:hypothetical protein
MTAGPSDGMKWSVAMGKYPFHRFKSLTCLVSSRVNELLSTLVPHCKSLHLSQLTTRSDSIRSVLPTDLFPLPNLSPTPSPQPAKKAPPMPVQRLKPVRLREISSSRSFLDDEGDSDGPSVSALPKPISPARPLSVAKPRVAEEERDDSWGW